MIMDLARLAADCLTDVALPDGAIGTIGSLYLSREGTNMAEVTGYDPGGPWTRHVPVTSLIPTEQLKWLYPHYCCPQCGTRIPDEVISYHRSIGR